MISKVVGEAAFNVCFLTPKSSTSPPMPPGSLWQSCAGAVECNNERQGLGLADLGWNPHSSTDFRCATLGRMLNLSGRA